MTTPAEHAAKQKALEAALGAIDKKFGRGAIMTFDSDALPDVEVYSTGSIALDSALGVGGVARGRIVEIFGPESSGKTTVCLQTAAAAQAAGFLVAFIDAEHALDPKYAQALGVSINDMLISQPDCGEDALEIADMLVRSGAVGLVIVDSVAALTPRAELEGEMGDSSVGLQARMMSKAMRKMAGQAKQTSTTMLFTNQIREKVGVMFGSPETQPGGRALKFFASQRLDIRRKETIKDGTEAVANRVKVKVVKNKVAPPFREAEFEIEFGAGVNQNQEIIDIGVEYNLVTKSGSFYSVGDIRIGQGKHNACKFLADPENADLRADLLAKVREAVGLKAPATAFTPDGTSAN